MSQFFEMGGYAAFVWPAYAVTLAAIVLNIVWARRALARSREEARRRLDRKSTRLNSSHSQISYAVFCLKKKKEAAHASRDHTDRSVLILRLTLLSKA